MAQKLIDPDQIDLDPDNPGVGIFMPAGGVIPYAGLTAPGGYILCNGQTLDSVANPEYAALYAAITTTYGGSGPADFDVPDLRGRVVVMVDGGTFAAEGTVVGSEDAIVVSHGHSDTFSVDAHSHDDGTLGTDTELNHTHGLGLGTVDLDEIGAGANDPKVGAGLVSDGGGSHDHDVTGSTGDTSPGLSGSVSAEGVPGTGANIQPSFTLNYIISLGL